MYLYICNSNSHNFISQFKVSDTKVVLKHKAEVEAVIPVIKTKLNLQSVVGKYCFRCCYSMDMACGWSWAWACPWACTRTWHVHGHGE